MNEEDLLDDAVPLLMTTTSKKREPLRRKLLEIDVDDLPDTGKPLLGFSIVHQSSFTVSFVTPISYT